MKKIIGIIIASLFISLSANAQQDTINNNVIYYAEQEIKDTKSGLVSYIPKGWFGVLPQDNEAFLLLPINSNAAQIMIMIYQMDGINQLKTQLVEGLDIAHGLTIKSQEAIQNKNDWIASDVDIMRTDDDASGYVEGTCSNGYCVLNVLISARDDLDALKQSMYRLSDKTSFESSREMGSMK